MNKPKPKPKPRTVQFGPIRLDPELYDAVKVAAENDGRSIAGYVRRVLKEKLSAGLKAGEKGE